MRQRVREEMGLTLSVGVADNKIFAKLGSDMKKPDATTVITPQNYREKVWPLPVSDLLFVGHATARRLMDCGVYTIGQLAQLPPGLPHAILGKAGEMLHRYANGQDTSPVAPADTPEPLLSIGNSTTTPRDLTCPEDIRIVLYRLCEEVAARMRRHGLYCRTVQLSVRDKELHTMQRQGKLAKPSHLSGELAALAWDLFARHYTWQRPVRSLGVRACDMVESPVDVQLDVFGNEENRMRRERLEKAMDGIRSRFGADSICRAMQLQDKALVPWDHMGDDLIHPDSAYNQHMDDTPRWMDAPSVG